MVACTRGGKLRSSSSSGGGGGGGEDEEAGDRTALVRRVHCQTLWPEPPQLKHFRGSLQADAKCPLARHRKHLSLILTIRLSLAGVEARWPVDGRLEGGGALTSRERLLRTVVHPSSSSVAEEESDECSGRVRRLGGAAGLRVAGWGAAVKADLLGDTRGAGVKLPAGWGTELLGEAVMAKRTRLVGRGLAGEWTGPGTGRRGTLPAGSFKAPRAGAGSGKQLGSAPDVTGGGGGRGWIRAVAGAGWGEAGLGRELVA